VISNSCET